MTACFATGDEDIENGSQATSLCVGLEDVDYKRAILSQKENELKKLQLEIESLRTEVVAKANHPVKNKTK